MSPDEAVYIHIHIYLHGFNRNPVSEFLSFACFPNTSLQSSVTLGPR